MPVLEQVSRDLPSPKGCQKLFSLKRGWFPAAASRAVHGRDAESPGLTVGVVLTHPACLWVRVSGLVPSPAPTMCAFSSSSDQGQTTRVAGEPSPCDSRQQTQAPGAQQALPRAWFPETPQQIPCPAIIIVFSGMKSAPLGSSQSPVAFGGSLQDSRVPWVLTQPALEPGASTLSPSLPAAPPHPQQLPIHCCHEAARSEGLSRQSSPKGELLTPKCEGRPPSYRPSPNSCPIPA